MIRARELRGLAVVDVDAATKVGKIEEVSLAADYHRIAGFLVAVGQSVLGKGFVSGAAGILRLRDH